MSSRLRPDCENPFGARFLFARWQYFDLSNCCSATGLTFQTDKLIDKCLSVSRTPIDVPNELIADDSARDRIMLSFELIVNGRQAGESTF
jgi:hypothetical protein